MKKYHLADVLSALELCCAVALGVMALTDVATPWALGTFVLGELCDAFDGICARCWHYPNDGKRRWWREYAKEIDQLTDLILAIAVLMYVATQVCWLVGVIIFGVSVIIGSAVEIRIHKWSPEDRRRRKYVLARRFLYLLAIATVIVLLIWNLPVEVPVRVLLTAIGVVVGLYLWIDKKDRRTEENTPL